MDIKSVYTISALAAMGNWNDGVSLSLAPSPLRNKTPNGGTRTGVALAKRLARRRRNVAKRRSKRTGDGDE